MRILSPDDVASRLSISRVTLWRWTRDNSSTFPRPLRLGTRKLGFVEDEIEAWLLSNRWCAS